MRTLADFIAEHGRIPLSWAGSTTQMNYLNFGDALSPVMVALCTGLPVTRIPTESNTIRLAAVGTIGHAFSGGRVHFWGTGCSSYRNPAAKKEEKIPYLPPANLDAQVAATRGPTSERLLTGGRGAHGVYGDPVWLLPRFYDPKLTKKWDLGVILHLSELTDREYEAHPEPKYLRYGVPGEFKDSVHLINTVTPISAAGLEDRLDEILMCKRIVSTSLHGMVIAESYGIPCLYFGAGKSPAGLVTADVHPDSGLDLRIVDMYGGLGMQRLDLYNQDRAEPTDWAALIAAIDRAWSPKTLDEDKLLGALPIAANPVARPDSGSIFDLALIRELELQHDVRTLKLADVARSGRVSAP